MWGKISSVGISKFLVKLRMTFSSNKLNCKPSKILFTQLMRSEREKKKKLFREELETLMHREEVMWSQKVRCNWVVLRDRNTRYFQTVVKQRRVRSRILQLNTDDGEVLKIREELNNRSYNTSSNLMGGPLQLMLTIFLRRSEPCLFHRYPTNIIWLLPHQWQMKSLNSPSSNLDPSNHLE